MHTLLQAATPPAFTSPEPNSTLPGSSATFTWVSNGTNTTQWWLHFGTAKGSYDLFDTGSLGTNQSATIDDFPTDGSTIWARLWYQLPGGWEFVDFQYSAAHIVTTYPLTVQKTGTGTGTISSSPAGVTCGNTCTASFDANTSITLSANPASDSDFGGWSGGGCSGTGACTVSLAQATTMTAAFAKIEPTTYSLTVQKTGTGTGTISSSPAGVTCGNTCTASFDANTSITLSATPASDSDFGGWSGGGCSGTGACTVSLAQATTMTAAFAKIEPTTYSLTVQKTGTGTGTISSSPAGVTCGNTCTASFDANTSITLSATPASDSDFGGWSGGGCSGTGACTVSLAQATTVTATFAEFQISVMAPSMVSPRQHSVLPGSSATLTWTPNGTDVTEWWLYVGTTKGAKNLFNQSIPSSTLSKTISGLPTDGNPVWVRFWWKTAKDGWQSTDVRYIAATGADATVPRPAITSPTGGTTLTGSTATFTWESHGTAVSEWWLLVGTKKGAQNLFNSHSLSSSTHSATAYGLPTDGSTVWAQLWWRVEADGSWRSADFQYTAANTSTSSLNPTLNTPTPGTRLPGYTSTFTWTPNGTDVTEWWLYVSGRVRELKTSLINRSPAAPYRKASQPYRRMEGRSGSDSGGKQQKMDGNSRDYALYGSNSYSSGDVDSRQGLDLDQAAPPPSPGPPMRRR